MDALLLIFEVGRAYKSIYCFGCQKDLISETLYCIFFKNNFVMKGHCIFAMS